MGIFLAVRAGDGDGRGADRGLADQGTALDRHRAVHHGGRPDPIGSVPRFTFGSEFIGGGFPFLPVLIGIFAFAQIMTDLEKLDQPRGQAGNRWSESSSSASRTSR